MDPAGYKLLDEPEKKPNTGPVTTLTAAASLDVWHQRIVRQGGKLSPTPTLSDHEGLWRELAECVIPVDALAFVERHGFLDRADADWESADHILRYAGRL